MGDQTKTKLVNVGTLVTIAIAVVSLLGAMLGVTHSKYSGGANKAQSKAISAAINLEQVSVVAHTWLFQDLRAYAEHTRLDALVAATETEAAAASVRGDQSRAQMLREQTAEYKTAAAAQATFFSPQYVLPGGAFDETRFLDDQFRFSSRNLDINPEKHFETAEALIASASLLRIGIYMLSVVVAFLIFAKVTKTKLRYVWIGIASLIFLGDVAYMLQKVFSLGV